MVLDICRPPLLVKVIDWGQVLEKRYRIPGVVGNLLGWAWERLTSCSSPVINADNADDIEVKRIFSFDEDIDEFWR